MKIESFYYWNTLNFLITQVFVSQSEVYYKVERLLTDRETCIISFTEETNTNIQFNFQNS